MHEIDPSPFDFHRRFLWLIFVEPWRWFFFLLSARREPRKGQVVFHTSMEHHSRFHSEMALQKKERKGRVLVRCPKKFQEGEEDGYLEIS